MLLHRGFDTLPHIDRPVVTIGSFDGVHLGHRALLEHVIQEARKVGGESVVVTFSPHPREVIPGRADNFRLLTSLQRKAELLEELGVDHLIVVEFTMEFAALTSEEFVRDFLKAKLEMYSLVVGYNHRFGHDRDVPDNHFELLGEKYDFEVVRAVVYRHDGGKVSSSVIRTLLAEGKTSEAEYLLGHKL